MQRKTDRIDDSITFVWTHIAPMFSPSGAVRASFVPGLRLRSAPSFPPPRQRERTEKTPEDGLSFSARTVADAPPALRPSGRISVFTPAACPAGTRPAAPAARRAAFPAPSGRRSALRSHVHKVLRPLRHVRAVEQAHGHLALKRHSRVFPRGQRKALRAVKNVLAFKSSA